MDVVDDGMDVVENNFKVNDLVMVIDDTGQFIVNDKGNNKVYKIAQIHSNGTYRLEREDTMIGSISKDKLRAIRYRPKDKIWFSYYSRATRTELLITGMILNVEGDMYKIEIHSAIPDANKIITQPVSYIDENSELKEAYDPTTDIENVDFGNIHMGGRRSRRNKLRKKRRKSNRRKTNCRKTNYRKTNYRKTNCR